MYSRGFHSFRIPLVYKISRKESVVRHLDIANLTKSVLISGQYAMIILGQRLLIEDVRLYGDGVNRDRSNESTKRRCWMMRHFSNWPAVGDSGRFRNIKNGRA